MMRKSTLLYTLLILFCAFSTVSCSSDDDDEIRFHYQASSVEKEKKVTNITTIMGYVSVRLSGMEGQYSIKSSDENILKVVPGGDINYIYITALRPGTAQIIVTDSRNSASLNVVVTKQLMTLNVIESAENVVVLNAKPENESDIKHLSDLIKSRLRSKGDRYELEYSELNAGAVSIYAANETAPLKVGSFTRVFSEEKGHSFEMKFQDETIIYTIAGSYLPDSQPTKLQLRSQPMARAYLIQDYSHLFSQYPNTHFTKADGVEKIAPM